MFNIGTGEIAFIALAALILLGPKGLPELARGIGKFMREFRRQTDEVRTVVEREFYRMDQELSLKEAPDVPEVVAANSVARKAAEAEVKADEVKAGDAKAGEADAAELLPAPAPDQGPSQLTKGMPPSEAAPPDSPPAAPPAAPPDSGSGKASS